jgi:hypothetical protein
MNLEVSREVLEKFKHKIQFKAFGGSQDIPFCRSDGQTDKHKAKQIVAFRSFAKAPKS